MNTYYFKPPEDIPEYDRPRVEDASKYTNPQLWELLREAGIPAAQIGNATKEASERKKHLVRNAGTARYPLPSWVPLGRPTPPRAPAPKPVEDEQPSEAQRQWQATVWKMHEDKEKRDKQTAEEKAIVLAKDKALDEAVGGRRYSYPIPPPAWAIRACAEALGLSAKETEQLVRTVSVCRRQAEAIGEIAGQQVIAEASHGRDKNFIPRYHGPDDMTRSPDGILREWEFKGTKDDSLDVAKDSQERKQGSRLKNLARAETMQARSDKIGLVWPTRQGGPYTDGEINELWQAVFDQRGDKEHYSVHANTETGEYRVCERNEKGDVIEKPGNPKSGLIINFKDKQLILRKLFNHERPT